MIDEERKFSFNKVAVFLSVCAFVLSIVSLSMVLKKSKSFTEKNGFEQKIDPRQNEQLDIVQQQRQEKEEELKESIKIAIQEESKKAKIEPKKDIPHPQKNLQHRVERKDKVNTPKKVPEVAKKKVQAPTQTPKIEEKPKVQAVALPMKEEEPVVAIEKELIVEPKKELEKEVARPKPFPRGGFAIQIGMFIDDDAAELQCQIASKKASDVFTNYGLSCEAKEFGEDENKRYKSVIKSFAERSQAAAVCRELDAKGIKCFATKL